MAHAALPSWLSVGSRVWFGTTWFVVHDIDPKGRVTLAYRGRIWRGFTAEVVLAAMANDTLRPMRRQNRCGGGV